MYTPEYFMREAIDEAVYGAKHGHGKPFGAVVARKDEIIGRGHNSVYRTGDPSSHAELTAMREACKHLGQQSLHDCVLYATGQPCLMCLGAMFTMRLPVLCYANSYADAEALGYTGGKATTSLAQTLGCADMCSTGDFVSSPALTVIRLPLPEALDLYTQWQKEGHTL